MVRPRSTGACVLVGATTHQGVAGSDPLSWPRPPWDAIGELTARYLGPVRRAGRGFLPGGTGPGEDEVMRVAGFQPPDRFEVGGGDVVERSADQIVEAVFSLSSAAPHLFGERFSAFESELRELLRQESPDGRFTERTVPVELRIWRR